jgi:hypothetical protein
MQARFDLHHLIFTTRAGVNKSGRKRKPKKVVKTYQMLSIKSSYRHLLRLANVASVDAVDGRERLTDLVRQRFNRSIPVRVSNSQEEPTEPEMQAEAVLRYLGKFCLIRFATIQCKQYCLYGSNFRREFLKEEGQRKQGGSLIHPRSFDG